MALAGAIKLVRGGGSCAGQGQFHRGGRHSAACCDSFRQNWTTLMGKLRTANNRAKRIRARVIAALSAKPKTGAPVKRAKGASKTASA
jgi:hypothetical protein